MDISNLKAGRHVQFRGGHIVEVVKFFHCAESDHSELHYKILDELKLIHYISSTGCLYIDKQSQFDIIKIFR